MREPRSILITGGAGFMGSAFARFAVPRVDRVVVVDALTYAGHRANVPDGAMFVAGDVRDGALLRGVCDEHGVDCVVHFAAETHVDRSIRGPAAFVETNLVGTFSVLELVRDRQLHLHHISTDEVFGSVTEPATEDAPYAPSSPYAASKAGADHLVRAWGTTFGVSTTLSRSTNNYGPRQYPEKLVPLMILRCMERRQLPVYGDGGHERDWLFVDDHSAAVWAVITRGAAGATWNVGTGEHRRNLDLVHAICDAVADETGASRGDLRGLVRNVEDRPGHDRRYALDCSRLRSVGWAPLVGLADGLRRTVRWYVEHPEWVAEVRASWERWMQRHYREDA